jgi:DNA-binding FadR family transcriptional regulator
MLMDSSTFKPVENKNLAEATAEQLVILIVKGQLEPGDRLPPEPELMAQLGSRRLTLREGVKSLGAAGNASQRGDFYQ